MKKMINKVTHKANMLAIKARMALTNNRAEGFVDTAIKILMAVVIGALVLAGLYMLFDKTVLPTLVQRIKDMFNYAGYGNAHADSKQQQRACADKRKAAAPSGERENVLCLHDLPVQEGRLLSLSSLVDLIPDAFGMPGQETEQAIRKFNGRQSEQNKSTGNKADAGN